MKRIVKVLSGIAVAMLFMGDARAEEKHGVTVYPGARYDAAASGNVQEAMKRDAACYRTGDEPSKVVAFYKKQPGLEIVLESARTSILKKGEVGITVQRPWEDMKTGAMNKDTLISIAR